MSLASVRRTLSTLRYLRPTQAVHFVRQRGLGPVAVSQIKSADRRVGMCSGRWLLVNSDENAPWCFRFLNITREFSASGPDWSPSDVPRLWRYNLHYFDCLNELGRPDSVKQQLIDSWIQSNPQGSQPAWEPYTASLRIANWVKYFLSNSGAINETRVASLFGQARWLRKNLELHILANHYFENIKALLFAGAFFSGEEADAWLQFAFGELSKQLREQTLTDGCHYERTPAYHCLMLQNYLELDALMIANPTMFDPSLVEQVRSASSRGLAFLVAILFPGDRIPLFNDSAFNSAPAPAALSSYASTLGIDFVKPSLPRMVDYSDAGIYGYIGQEDGFLIDCGDIGPAYQPGHTHCDFLSYELVLVGHPLIVDTGVYEYEPGEMRQYVRSTRAHNTISVDGDEQSEIWGEFRVARRAKKLRASIVEQDGAIVFEGAYRGFYALGGKIQHHRKVTIRHAQGAIDGVGITDRVFGSDDHHIESYIHFHPDVHIADNKAGKLSLMVAGQEFVLTIADGLEYRVENTLYCPEFGLKIPNSCITISTQGGYHAELSYQIEKLV